MPFSHPTTKKAGCREPVEDTATVRNQQRVCLQPETDATESNESHYAQKTLFANGCSAEFFWDRPTVAGRLLSGFGRIGPGGETRDSASIQEISTCGKYVDCLQGSLLTLPYTIASPLSDDRVRVIDIVPRYACSIILTQTEAMAHRQNLWRYTPHIR